LKTTDVYVSHDSTIIIKLAENEYIVEKISCDVERLAEYEFVSKEYRTKTENLPKYPPILMDSKSSVPVYELVGFLRNGDALYDLCTSSNRTNKFQIIKNPTSVLTKYLTILEDDLTTLEGEFNYDNIFSFLYIYV